MPKLVINTGSSPNDGTGDSLLVGGTKANDNFNEIYTTIGDGTTLAVPVTSVAAGAGINVSGSTGSVTISATSGTGSTANISADTLNVSGVSTFNNDVVINGGFDLDMNGGGDLDLTSGSVIRMGTSNADNFDVFNNGSFSIIRDNAVGQNGLLIDSVTKVAIQKSGSGNDSMAVFTVDGSADLYYDGVKKFETTGTGVTISGTTQTQQLNVTGNTFATNITPTVDSNWSLGTDTTRWGTVYSDRFIGNGLNTNADLLTLGASSATFTINFSQNTGSSPQIRNTVAFGADSGLGIYGAYSGGGTYLEDAFLGTSGSRSRFKNLDPQSDVTYDLGSSTKKWNNLYTQQLNVSGVSTFTGAIGIGTAGTIYSSSGATEAVFNVSAVGDFTLGANTFGKQIRVLAQDDVIISSTQGSVLTRSQQGAKLIDSDSVLGDVSLSYVTSSGSSGSEERLVTTGAGVTVFGSCSATSFSGDGSNLVDGKWNLGANGILDYTFTGIGFTQTTNDPILYLARGRVYEFVNTMNAHPFQIRVSKDGSAYNAGVTNNGTQNGTVRFEIPMDAPNTLYYQCTSHSGMGSTISVYPNTI